jgi:alpha-D-ribose 1-methylphosphonate 5-triphosphate diphosphatase PhnM
MEFCCKTTAPNLGGGCSYGYNVSSKHRDQDAELTILVSDYLWGREGAGS